MEEPERESFASYVEAVEALPSCREELDCRDKTCMVWLVTLQQVAIESEWSLT